MFKVYQRKKGLPPLFFLSLYFPLLLVFPIRHTARSPYFHLHTDQDWLWCCRYNSVHILNRLAFSNSTRNLPGEHQALSASFLKWISSLLLVQGMCLKDSHWTNLPGIGLSVQPTCPSSLLWKSCCCSFYSIWKWIGVFYPRWKPVQLYLFQKCLFCSYSVELLSCIGWC